MNLCDLNLSQAQLTLLLKQQLLDANVWNRTTDNLGNEATKTIDTLSMISFTSVKYIITVFNTTEGKVVMKEFSIVKTPNGDVKETVHAKLGKGISHTIIPAVVGGDLQIVVENQEDFPIEVTIARLVS